VEEIAPKFIDTLVFIVRKLKSIKEFFMLFNKVGIFVFFDGCMFWSSLFRNTKLLNKDSLSASKASKNIACNVFGTLLAVSFGSISF
jgi:hypothetical protein